MIVHKYGVPFNGINNFIICQYTHTAFQKYKHSVKNENTIEVGCVREIKNQKYQK